MGAVKFGITKAPKYGKAVADWVKGKFKKTSPTIKSVPLSPNLTKRRIDRDDIVKAVDDTRKRFNVPKTAKSDTIKYDAIKKTSKIHDKADKIKAGRK
tara:strand:- start:465 stop:758 length:294 start_codon:yes stop_codon:yes gene_type:complete